MSDTNKSAEDLAILEQLNLDQVKPDQAGDAKRFSEFLAEDFLHRARRQTGAGSSVHGRVPTV
jgi:hypothetical protein